MSSTFHQRYRANRCTDGDPSTLCASDRERHAWLSIDVGSGSRVGVVSVLNRADSAVYMSWLSPFEIWVGRSAGDTTSANAVRCGDVQYVPSAAGPFTVDCRGAVGSHVTLRLAGDNRRYLTIAELLAYRAT